MNTLAQFSKEQEKAVNDMAKKARKLLFLPTPQLWDLEAWFDKAKKVNPYLKGVSIREFGGAVLELEPFKN